MRGWALALALAVPAEAAATLALPGAVAGAVDDVLGGGTAAMSGLLLGALLLGGAAAAALAAAAAMGFAIRRRLGGLTGDVYGAAVEVAETVFLVCAGAR
jgi:cobalamin synthase